MRNESKILRYSLNGVIVLLVLLIAFIVFTGGIVLTSGNISVSIRGIRNPSIILSLALIIQSVMGISLLPNNLNINKQVCIYTGIALGLISLYIGLNYYMVMPYADQFDFTNVYETLSNQNGRYDISFGYHGGHFHTIPFIVMYVLSIFSNWNILWEEIFSLILYYMILILLLITILNDIKKHDARISWLYIFIVIVIYLSLGQTKNLIWTWQLAVFIATFGVILALYGLSAIKNYYLSLITASAGYILAFYSFATGFVIWPVGLFYMFFAYEKSKRKTVSICVWILIGIALNYHYYVVHTIIKVSDINIHNISVFINYIAVYLGACMVSFGGVIVALLIGYIGLIIFFVMSYLFFTCSHEDRKKYLLLYSLTLFGLGGAVLTSFARFQFGITQALAPRYYSFSMFYWIGVFGFLISSHEICRIKLLLDKYSSNPVSITNAIAIIVILFTLSGMNIAQKSIQVSNDVNEVATELNQTYPEISQNIFNVLHYPPGNQYIRKSLGIMFKHKLNIFRQTNVL